MNRDDIIRMARASGCHDNGEEVRFVELRYLERFAALVAAAATAEEREACARVCDERAKEMWGFTEEENASQCLAAAIRARGEKK